MQIWGIVNVTPDSFSDGGRFLVPERAVEHGLGLVAAGADVLDVGGESTRPGAQPVGQAQELERILPVIAGLRAQAPDVPVSVDTRHARVAEAALMAGATIVNDVSAAADPDMLTTVVRHGAGLVLMHMRGTPATMQREPTYGDVVAEVGDWLMARAAAAAEAGVDPQRVWIDPGLGFGKTLEHNLALLQGLETLVARGPPLLLGASRKSFLGILTGRQLPAERVAGSLACVARARTAGVAAVRVHDVAETRDLLAVLAQIG
ncbi:MAG: dihydropteroate synthase [Planctomycetota bacterium]|nr:dihydropteroate synthase [Planctomycetota bacterium]